MTRQRKRTEFVGWQIVERHTWKQYLPSTTETVTDCIFLGFKITADGDCSCEIKICLLHGRKAMTNLQYIKKKRHHFANRGLSNQSYDFSSSHIWMWELDHKEGWVPKNWCFWTVVLEKTLESPLDCQEIQPINPKGNQPWIFIWRIDVKGEVSILQLPDVRSRLIGKGPDAEKDWSQEKKGMTEDKLVGWHRWLSGHEFEQTPGDSKGQGSLACCSPWGRKESDMTK